MNKQDKDMIQGFLDRTKPKKKKHQYKPKIEPLTKQEQQELNKAYLREMIIDTIILAIVVVTTVAALAWIVGKLNGQNC